MIEAREDAAAVATEVFLGGEKPIAPAELRAFVDHMVTWVRARPKGRPGKGDRHLLIWYTYWAFTQRGIDLRQELARHVEASLRRELTFILDDENERHMSDLDKTASRKSLSNNGRQIANRFRASLSSEQRQRWAPLISMLGIGFGLAAMLSRANAATQRILHRLGAAKSVFVGTLSVVAVITLLLFPSLCGQPDVRFKGTQDASKSPLEQGQRAPLEQGQRAPLEQGQRAPQQRLLPVEEFLRYLRLQSGYFRCDLESLADAARELGTQDCGKIDNNLILEDAVTLTREQKCAISAYQSGIEFLLRVQYHSREDLFVAQREGDGLRIHRCRWNTYSITHTSCFNSLDSVTDWLSRGCLREEEDRIGKEICYVDGQHSKRE